MTEQTPQITTEPARGYWQLVWGQYCKSYWAVGGLVLVFIFFSIALLAPFLASLQPFVWTMDGDTTFPFVREFFAPVNTTERLLTAFFNYCLLAIVPIVLLKRYLPAAIRGYGIVAFCLLLLIPFIFVSGKNQPLNYRMLADAGKGEGIFPLIPYGANEEGFGPKVAPSWYFGSSDVTPDHVRNWGLLSEQLRDAAGGDTPISRIWAQMPESVQQTIKNADAELLMNPQIILTYRKTRDALAQALPGAQMLQARTAFDQATVAYNEEKDRVEENRAPVLAALNQALRKTTIFTKDDFESLKLRDEAWEFVGRDDLRADEMHRLNHLALEKTLPRCFSRAVFPQRKWADQKAGYHLLGTDEIGRDVLVRMIHGARVSLAVGFVSVGIATLIGLTLGSIAGYFGGWTDILISRLIEVMMCFPTFFLILTLIALMEKRSILNIMIVIGVTGWTGTARMIRAEVLKNKRLDYVASAQALGATSPRIIFRHILPNAIAPVLVGVSFGIAGAILTESGLSFIGFGVAPPTATWGELLNQGRGGPLINWWLVVFPGILIFLSVTAYNLVGEGLRDAMDPRLRR